MIDTTHIQLDGHSFDRLTGMCAKCGMSRAKYDDSGKPHCDEPSPEKRERLPIDDQD